MKKLTIAVAAFLSPMIFAQTYVDLSQSFNADVFLETGGTGLIGALDPEGRRIDSGSLPASYVDGAPATSTNGRATFQFARLKAEGMDAVRVVDVETIDVTDGRYSSVDFALLSAPGSFVNPFPMIDFIYADGSTNSARLGPVAGWFSSPTVFDNALLRYTDQRGVTEHVSFPTDGTSDADYLFQTQGSALSGGWRFADGNGYFLYRIDTTTIDAGKLGITIGNNFVISVGTTYHDPGVTGMEGFTKLASSQEIHGVDHHSLGNLKEYEFDVTPYLAGSDELYILLTDGSTSDGWGPYVQRIRLFEGEALNFEERLRPTIDASNATVYADFQIASTNETPFLFDNSGSGPSNRGHRFADGTGSLTYRFNLPDNVTEAKMTVDMENNFVVSLAGPASGTSFGKFAANTPTEAAFLIEAPGTATQPNARFADGGAHMIYEFDLPDTVTAAFARVQVGNQFVISAAAGAAGEYVTLKDFVAETGNEIRDNSNLDFYTVDLTTFFVNNPSKVVRIRLTDGVPTDGWGPYLRGIEVVESATAGALNYVEVLNSQVMFGEDFHNEANRNYYTIDLSSVLTNNNPGREVNIRFTDGSTTDGWGPSVYWMSVYSGEIEISSDSLIFPNLKTTAGDPASRPVGLMSRNYPLDPTKTLTAIRLPEHPEDQTARVYVLAATLNATTTAVPQLQVARVDGDSLRISWPAAEGYRLQFSATLGATAQWTNVTAPVQNNGGTMSAEVDTSAQSGFYRLIK